MFADISHRMTMIIDDLESSGNLVSAAHVQMALDALCVNGPSKLRGGAPFAPIFAARVRSTNGSLAEDESDDF
jgi:hypothetical protein